MKWVMIQFFIPDDVEVPEDTDLDDFFYGVNDGQISVLDLEVNSRQMPPQLKWPEDEDG